MNCNLVIDNLAAEPIIYPDIVYLPGKAGAFNADWALKTENLANGCCMQIRN